MAECVDDSIDLNIDDETKETLHSLIEDQISQEEAVLPETQPIAEENPICDANLELSSFSDVWGWLQPTPQCKVQPIGFEKDEYTFGRDPRCSYVFSDRSEFETIGLFKGVSKLHFAIEKKKVENDAVCVRLHDISTNGTFVNTLKVGRGSSVTLNNNDIISLVAPSNEVFVFIDNSFSMSWMPVQEMRGRFYLKALLGKGSYGEVRMARDKLTCKDVAIKKVQKNPGNECQWESEINILRKPKNPFVVSMENYYESSTHVFIVLEYVSGGTLQSKVSAVNKLHDDEAKFIFYQLVLALEFLHDEGVAHRDLKPENVLLAPYKEGELVKVTDFGLSKICKNVDVDLKTMCGTLYFIAPEILSNRGSYTMQVDIWSLGVSLFYCISGLHPFNSERPGMCVSEQIIRGSYGMMGREWKGVNTKVISLIRKMLVVDPGERIMLADIKCHPWFKDDRMLKKLDILLKAVESSASRVSSASTSPDRSPAPKRVKYDPNTETVRKS